MKRLYWFFLLFVFTQLCWGQNKADEIRNTFLNDNLSQLLVVAHRGDWRNAPENSLQGIQNCIDMGVDMVEIDLKNGETKKYETHLSSILSPGTKLSIIMVSNIIFSETTEGSGFEVSDWTETEETITLPPLS